MTLERRSFLLSLGSVAFLPPAKAQRAAVPRTAAATLISAARQQIGVTRGYDGAYKSLAYPNGDVPRATGVCTDVIIRAYRDGFDYDLQKFVHEDMRANFSTYPPNWGLSRPDKNIDHRRVPNLENFLKRKAAKLLVGTDPSAFAPGDLLTMRLPNGNLPHIALVTDKSAPDSSPYIIHNIGAGTREEPLTSYRLDTMLHARFRYLKNVTT